MRHVAGLHFTQCQSGEEGIAEGGAPGLLPQLLYLIAGVGCGLRPHFALGSTAHRVDAARALTRRRVGFENMPRRLGDTFK